MQIVFLDTETTGKGDDSRLVQLCWKIADQPANSLLVKPPTQISFGAMATHHITEKMVESKSSFHEATDDSGKSIKAVVQDVLDNSILVAHNAKFDIAVLEREGLRVGRRICTLKVAQRLFDEPEYKLQYLRYKFGLEIPEGVVAHDAVGDVIVLEELFNHLTSHISIPEMEELTSLPVLLRRIGFGKHKGEEFKDLPLDYLSWLYQQTDIDEDLLYTLKHYLRVDI